MSNEMICIHGFNVLNHEFFSLENVKYCFKNQDSCRTEFELKEYQVKKSDIVRFEAFSNEGDIFIVIIGNQYGMGNMKDKDILVLVIDLDEMVSCLEVMK